MCAGDILKPVAGILGGVSSAIGLGAAASESKTAAVAPTQIPKATESQAAKAPTAASQRTANSLVENAQGATPSTLLTGADGISADSLNLGKNTLLGR